ncbi:hypothetical protein [Bacteroides thetaiotaomicron]|uniref:hypothetical protein n=1 Tax=Bacteroides thetaiotaomicron TaxID=818 RepID=UPI001F5B4917|nr:hypothetical protein [Bacteroides thetaiotaomicron]
MNINTIPTNRIRSIAFNKKIEGYADEAEYMIVAIDYDGKGDESPSVYIINVMRMVHSMIDLIYN